MREVVSVISPVTRMAHSPLSQCALKKSILLLLSAAHVPHNVKSWHPPTRIFELQVKRYVPRLRSYLFGSDVLFAPALHTYAFRHVQQDNSSCTDNTQAIK
jgi:hypothetical protein